MDSQRPTIFNSSYNSTNTRPSTAIWGLAAMTAAEVGFPTDSSESWFNCAVNLHSKLMWKSGHFCTDGLSPDSQNLIGQQFGYLTGTYFQLTSRIAYASSGEQRRFFADRASAVWSWSVKNHILNESDWTINSLVAGMDNNTACFVLKDWRLASSYGLWLSGAAYMFKMVSCLRREVLLALLFEFSCCSFCRPKGSIECWQGRYRRILIYGKQESKAYWTTP